MNYIRWIRSYGLDYMIDFEEEKYIFYTQKCKVRTKDSKFLFGEGNTIEEAIRDYLKQAKGKKFDIWDIDKDTHRLKSIRTIKCPRRLTIDDGFLKKVIKSKKVIMHLLENL